MATIKSYTDIFQSMKLADILPIESADMTYYACVRDWMGKPVKPRWGKPANALRKEIALPCANHQVYEYVSAWSFASLLSVLPEGTRLLKSSNISSVGDVKYHIECPKGNIDKWFDNPVDACYEMIIRLHELNLL